MISIFCKLELMMLQYTKSHPKINPLAITPLGPIPPVESGFEPDFSKLRVGHVDLSGLKKESATEKIRSEL